MMKISDWLRQATVKLEDAGIGTARLDALILAEDACGKDRAYLLAHPDLDVKGRTFHTLEEQLKRRAMHEPLAYIRGKTEFYGREFVIDHRVLEPRPESETMIELLLDQVKRQKLKVESIVDVGTGSGALAITAKLELPLAQVIAVDIDSKCLQVARQNIKKHSVKVETYQANLLEPLATSNFSNKKHGRGFYLIIVMANLPYIPDSYAINQAAMNEPKLAIFGGADGLDIYRQLFAQIAHYSQKPKYVLTESMPPQHKKLAEIAKNHGYILQQTDDFIQLFTRV